MPFRFCSRGGRFLWVRLVAVALLSSVATGPLHPPANVSAEPVTASQSGQELVQALRGGGYVIFLRHGPTIASQEDSDPEHLENCDTQRNLSDEGRELARQLGEDLRILAIPIGQVLTSEYCRARETAELAFHDAEPTPFLNFLTLVPTAAREPATAALREWVTTPPPPGTNLVLVSHGPNVLDIGVLLNTEGEAAVFHPEGHGLTQVVAQLLPVEWDELAGR
jgi:phosphohistidine phosphatase SixA